MQLASINSVASAISAKHTVETQRNNGVFHPYQNVVLNQCAEVMRHHKATAVNDKKYSNGAGCPRPHMPH